MIILEGKNDIRDLIKDVDDSYTEVISTRKLSDSDIKALNSVYDKMILPWLYKYYDTDSGLLKDEENEMYDLIIDMHLFLKEFLNKEKKDKYKSIKKENMKKSELIGLIKEAYQEVIKESKLSDQIELPTCNLLLNGIGRDSNGNRFIQVEYSGDKPFTIQINDGSLKKTYEITKGINLPKNIPSDKLEIISKEIGEWVKKNASTKQKSKLKIYESNTITKSELINLIKESYQQILKESEVKKALVNKTTGEVLTRGVSDSDLEHQRMTKHWDKNKDLVIINDSDLGELYIKSNGSQYMKNPKNIKESTKSKYYNIYGKVSSDGFVLYYYNDSNGEFDVFGGDYKTISDAKKEAEKKGYEEKPMWMRESTKRVLKEGVDKELQDIADAIKGYSMMSMRKPLEALYDKRDIDFSLEPITMFKIKSKTNKNKKIAIVNKQYSDPDVNDIVVDSTYVVGYL